MLVELAPLQSQIRRTDKDRIPLKARPKLSRIQPSSHQYFFEDAANMRAWAPRHRVSAPCIFPPRKKIGLGHCSRIRSSLALLLMESPGFFPLRVPYNLAESK